MPSGPFGGPRPFVDDDCFPATPVPPQGGIIDFSKLNEVKNIDSWSRNRGSIDIQNNELINTYKLIKPASIVSSFGHTDGEIDIMDEFENRLSKFFYVSTSVEKNTEYYKEERDVYISRYGNLPSLVRDSHLNGKHDIVGLLLGYNPESVGEFLINNSTGVFK